MIEQLMPTLSTMITMRELGDLHRDRLRYEALRTLNPQQFADLHKTNIHHGIPFDTLVDQLVTKPSDNKGIHQ